MGIELGVDKLFSQEKRDFLNKWFLENKRGVLASIPSKTGCQMGPPHISPDRMGMADIGETAPSSAVEADGGASLCANWSIGQLGPGPVSSALQHTGTGRLEGRQTIIGRNGLPSGGALEAPKGCPMPLGYKKGEGAELDNENKPGPWVRDVEKKNENL